MKKAILFTAFNRPNYLLETLRTWERVRKLIDWDIRVQLEPSPVASIQAKLFREHFPHHDVDIQINPHIYGVLHNPWVGFDYLFNSGYDFVLRAEDDLIVSTDILEFFNWASRKYENDEEIATVHGFTHENGNIAGARRVLGFQPWVWGTWKDRWDEYIGPTWDHDYSTNNGNPGEHAGWDWNLNERIFPSLGKKSIYPLASRVNNIGVYGTHASGEQDFVQTDSFLPGRGRLAFHEITTV